MANRWRDWWRQAERDLAHARHDAETGFPEHACFESQQAAEKALKALIMHRGGEPWGHSLLRLLESIGGQAAVPAELFDTARELDKLYVPARYPNGLAEGAPMDFYTEDNAREALRHAEDLFRYCRSEIPES